MQIPVLDVALSRKATEPLYRGLMEDIQAFVNRSSEIRQYEARLRRKIKRESNAFILYRKCYRNVATKIAQEHVNDRNQISVQVSILCGFSWKNLELDEVKSAFKSWSITDRLMLLRTFPNYSYHPIKRGRTKERQSMGVINGKDILYQVPPTSDSRLLEDVASQPWPTSSSMHAYFSSHFPYRPQSSTDIIVQNSPSEHLEENEDSFRPHNSLVEDGMVYSQFSGTFDILIASRYDHY